MIIIVCYPHYVSDIFLYISKATITLEQVHLSYGINIPKLQIANNAEIVEIVRDIKVIQKKCVIADRLAR